MNINDAFPSQYLKASDLQGRVVQVTIDRCEYANVGKSQERKPILFFAGKEKGLILNKTNVNALLKMGLSPDTEEWGGIKIALVATEVEFQGDMVPAIRIKPPIAASKKPVAVAPVEEGDDETPF